MWGLWRGGGTPGKEHHGYRWKLKGRKASGEGVEETVLDPSAGGVDKEVREVLAREKERNNALISMKSFPEPNSHKKKKNG